MITRRANGVLFVSHAMRGHAAQMVELAKELTDRDIRVRYAMPREGEAWLAGSPVEYIPWEPKMGNHESFNTWVRQIRRRASLETQDSNSRTIVNQSMVDSYEPMYRSLAPIYRSCQPSLVFVGLTAFAGIDLAAQLGIPCVVYSFFLPAFVRHKSFLTRARRTLGSRHALRTRLLPLLQPWLLCRSISASRRLKTVKRRLTSGLPFIRYLQEYPVIVGTHECIEDISQLSSPCIHLVGPILPKTEDPAEPSLRQWLDEGRDEGVVLAAFGSLVTPSPGQIKLLANGLKYCPCRILWAMPERYHGALAAISPSFRAETFIPQPTVLAHPAVRAFISHCGSNSVREALYWGKPILGMPFFLDQPYFGERIASLGVGLLLDRNRFTSNEVRRKTARLLETPSILEKARRISDILKSQHGRETGADILERALSAALPEQS
jgi:2-hydroxyacylsphingosine 1-beta-galactosyltransferase